MGMASFKQNSEEWPLLTYNLPGAEIGGMCPKRLEENDARRLRGQEGPGKSYRSLRDLGQRGPAGAGGGGASDRLLLLFSGEAGPHPFRPAPWPPLVHAPFLLLQTQPAPQVSCRAGWRGADPGAE